MKPYDLIKPDRFFAKVDASRGHGPDGDCHLWRGPLVASGTGVLAVGRGKTTINFKAHRAAHWLHYGYMPDDLFCIHACGVVNCVNSRHLYLSPRRKGEASPRLMRLVDMSPGQGPNGDCWEFTGYRNPKMGYGNFSDDRGKTVAAHRFMFSIVHGSIPEHLHVCHICDNPPCCNPDHLFLGSHADNMADRNAKGRQSRSRKWSKLTDKQVAAIKQDERTQNEIAADYSVSRTLVSFIRNGRRRAHIV
jgi:hypothetical protein